mmetsp:Transcript_16440/g.29893  ORF Transcript_16440/g.29893 Transcript_16440/m.29893 type:complete len:249 (-) Transcript_16440:523-1269(-)
MIISFLFSNFASSDIDELVAQKHDANNSPHSNGNATKNESSLDLVIAVVITIGHEMIVHQKIQVIHVGRQFAHRILDTCHIIADPRDTKTRERLALEGDYVIALANTWASIRLNNPFSTSIGKLEHINASQTQITNGLGRNGKSKNFTLGDEIKIVQAFQKLNEKSLFAIRTEMAKVLFGINIGQGDNRPGEFAGHIQKLDITEIFIRTPRDDSKIECLLCSRLDSTLCRRKFAGKVFPISINEFDLD